MSTIFFTADQHFGHPGIIGMCQRPFTDVDEMDEALIKEWNAVVRKGDTVWHLGDFAHKANAERCQSIFGRLNGRKHLVLGNHDEEKVRTLGWASAPTDRVYLRHPGEKMPLVLDHYAMRSWSQSHYGAIHFYGHSHGALPGHIRSLDVGMDCWSYRPVALEELRPVLDQQWEPHLAEREARARAAANDDDEEGTWRPGL